MFNSKKDATIQTSSNIFKRGGEITEILFRSRTKPIPSDIEVEKIEGTNKAVLHGYSCPRCGKNTVLCAAKEAHDSSKLVCFCDNHECLQDDAEANISKTRKVWRHKFNEMTKQKVNWEKIGDNKFVRKYEA